MTLKTGKLTSTSLDDYLTHKLKKHEQRSRSRRSTAKGLQACSSGAYTTNVPRRCRPFVEVLDEKSETICPTLLRVWNNNYWIIIRNFIANNRQFVYVLML